MKPPRLLTSCRAAIGFLTILPVSPPDAAGALARAHAWFPAVGLLLGGMIALFDLALRALHLRLLWPAP